MSRKIREVVTLRHYREIYFTCHEVPSAKSCVSVTKLKTKVRLSLSPELCPN